MQPALDDLYYFAAVVEHGGFAAAGRVLGVPKSRLSRRVEALEARLGLRLLQRSTRRFHVTEVGREVHRHAQGMLAEADAALDAAAAALAEPSGLLRVACPVALAGSLLAAHLPAFLQRYPRLRLELEVSNRRVDVLAEGFDLAIRVRSTPSGEDDLVMRRFAELEELLVASPDYLDRMGEPVHPDELAAHQCLSFVREPELQTWTLKGPSAEPVRVEIRPRLRCHSFDVLHAAALAGQGIALMPESVVRASLAEGRLRRVLPDWCLPQGVLHAVFPHRRGLLPGVRAFIDFLVEIMPPAMPVPVKPAA